MKDHIYPEEYKQHQIERTLRSLSGDSTTCRKHQSDHAGSTVAPITKKKMVIVTSINNTLLGTIEMSGSLPASEGMVADMVS